MTKDGAGEGSSHLDNFKGKFYKAEKGKKTGDQVTMRMRRFVNHYMANGMNGKKAAISAGYAPKWATIKAHNLIRNPKVKALIHEIFSAEVAGPGEVLASLTAQLRASVTDIVNEKGELDMVKVKALGKLVESLEVEPGSMGGKPKAKVKLYSAQKAAELLGRFHKLFGNDIEVNAVATAGVLQEMVIQVEPKEGQEFP